MYQAIKALRMYNVEKNVWGQAHCLAAYAIFSAVRKECPNLITFEFTEKEGKEYFYMNVDRSKLRTDGHNALSKFLKKLHILKSIGDFDQAKEWFDGYSSLDEEILKVKALVELHKKPRRIELQPNLFAKGADGAVEYKDYDESFEGIIQSYCERFEGVFMGDVYDEWCKHAEKMRYPSQV